MFVSKHCREGRQEFRVFADVESTIQNFDARGGGGTYNGNKYSRLDVGLQI